MNTKEQLKQIRALLDAGEWVFATFGGESYTEVTNVNQREKTYALQGIPHSLNNNEYDPSFVVMTDQSCRCIGCGMLMHLETCDVFDHGTNEPYCKDCAKEVQ